LRLEKGKRRIDREFLVFRFFDSRSLRMSASAILLILTLLPQLLAAQQPHYDGRKKQLEYPGPGRELGEPADVTEVRIGYFGPGDHTHPLAGDMWLAAQMALEEANAEGGYRGLPFRLLAVWSENPWEGGDRDLVRLVYNEKVWAIVGGIDGASTHLAEQITAKSRLALVNPASTDKTVSYAFVPWVFSIPPGDHIQAPVLCAAVKEALASPNARFAMISAVDHDSQLAMAEFRSLLAKQGIVPSFHVQVRSINQEIAEAAEKIAAFNPSAILVVAGAVDSANLVLALRKAGSKATVYGSCTMGRRIFLETAGQEAEGVIFPVLGNPSPDYNSFSKRFSSRSGHAPDFTAIYTYDAVRLVVEAIRRSGLNRALIRDAIRDLSGWQGTSGKIEWDPVGQNVAPVWLGSYRRGKIQVLIDHR